MKPLTLIATCARGLEPLLADELHTLFAQDVVAADRIVHFKASPEVAYRVLLGTRLANRILWPVCVVNATSADDLYHELLEHEWSQYLTPDKTLSVDFVGESEVFRNSMFGAQRVKDALVDSTRVGELRSTVAKEHPDVRFNAVLLVDKHGADTVQVAIDLGNGSLHRRGYRQEAGEAPLKETVAAAMLVRAGWPAIAKAGGTLFDPFCGSGTLLIEAALMAGNIPPGTFRQHWGVACCPWHDEALWHSLRQDAHNRLLNIDIAGLPRIIGTDVLTTVVRKARSNIERAGLTEHITVEAEHLSDSMPPRSKTGLLICNPPYGERMDADPDLVGLYSLLGEKMGALEGWQGAVLTSEKKYAQAIGLRSHRSYRFDNGAIPCRLYLFELNERNHFKPVLAVQQDRTFTPDALSESAMMLYNRLLKNRKSLQPWLKQENISCFRLYDADLPEYAFAVDVYQELDTKKLQVHLQEYAPPKTVDEQAAARRREETQLAVSAALQLPMQDVHFKRRERQRGENQYSKQKDSYSKNVKDIVVEDKRFRVNENRHSFWVDMDTYLDTGLFLDTRPVRAGLARLAKGRRFLNLFCYTASATVYAAAAGARSSLSIDMSPNYIDWARHNFAANSIDTRKHVLLAEDCIQWLEQAIETDAGQFDLIYLDPPTFSNSKRMQSTLDIQRDHVDLIGAALQLLSADGVLVFVTNHQRFKLDEAAFEAAGWPAKNISAQTIDRDFQRSQKIHQCWLFGEDD
jgi:23S rRNA (guanine2445-N2)-methyltransferase / 23S rRNA (guanine2069-N7)-methyltransferase